MRIKEYQQGGGLIYTPYIKERQAAQTASGSKSGDDEDPKLDPLDKELIALLKDKDLLPSDIQMISNALVTFQRRTQHLSDSAGFGGTGSYRSVMPYMLQIMQMVSTARFNKGQWDNAVSEIQKHDAGSEVALDSYGRMYVADDSEKGYKLVSPTEFAKDPTAYTPLSNSQLMSMRERIYGFGDGMLDAMNDVAGKQDIYKAVNDIIKNYGTVENARYLTKDKTTQNILIDANSPDGIYKLSQTYSKGEMDGAAQVLFAELPTNMQHLLRANAALAGLDPTTGALSLIQQIITRNISSKQDVHYDDSLSKAAGYGHGSGSSGDDLKEHDTYQIRFANGLGEPTQFALTPTAAKVSDQGTMIASGTDFGPMLDMDLMPLGQMNLQQLLFGGKTGSALAASVRSSDVTFGKKVLDYSELPTVMYNQESLTSKVYLPVKNVNGHYTPDFDLLERFNAFKKEYKPSMTTLERNSLLQKHQLDASSITTDEKGNLTLADVRPFLAFSAYAGDDTLNLTDDEKRYLAKVDRAKGKTLVDPYNTALKYNKTDVKKSDTAVNKGFHKATRGDFWEGVVFIPAFNTFYANNSSKDQPVTKESLIATDRKDQANEILRSLEMQARQNQNYEQNRSIGQFRNE